jgi:hypothetical protein
MRRIYPGPAAGRTFAGSLSLSEAAISTSAGVTAICATFAIGFLIMSLRGYSFARRARHWPWVEGTITRSQIGLEYQYKGFRAAHVDLEYRYEVRGMQYTGTRVTFDTRGGDSRAVADAILARYPVGGETKVFFDSDDPSESVLDPESTRTPRQALLLGIGAGVMGMVAATTDIFGPR